MKRMTAERYAAIMAALRKDRSNLNAAAKEVGCAWKSVQLALEDGAGHRPIREVFAEEDAVRRSIVAEQDEVRQAEVARIRDEILADYNQRMGQLDAREADMQRRVAELEALTRDTETRTKRLHSARVEHGRSDGDAVREQEAMILRNARQRILVLDAIMQGALTPDGVRNLMLAIRRGVEDKSISARDALATWKVWASFEKTRAEAAKITSENERLVGGDPTHITEHRVTIEPAEVEASLADMERLLAQHKADAAPLEDAEVLPVLPAPEPVQCPAEGAGCNAGTACAIDDVQESSQVPATTGDEGQGGGEGGGV